MNSLAFQPRQPLLSIINLSYPRVGILPQVEEFHVILNGYSNLIYQLSIFSAIAEILEARAENPMSARVEESEQI